MNTRPDVNVSRPAAQCMSVDLPEPDGPMMAVNSPDANWTVTSSVAASPYTLRAFSVRAAAVSVAFGVTWGLLVVRRCLHHHRSAVAVTIGYVPDGDPEAGSVSSRA